MILENPIENLRKVLEYIAGYLLNWKHWQSLVLYCVG